MRFSVGILFFALLSAFIVDGAAHAEETYSLRIVKNSSGNIDFIQEGEAQSYDGIKRIVSSAMARGGAGSRYKVIFTDEVPFKSVIDTKKLLNAVGFSRVTYFVTSDGPYMVEIKFGEIFSKE